MKKIICSVLCVILLLGCIGCSGDTDTGASDIQPNDAGSKAPQSNTTQSETVSVENNESYVLSSLSSTDSASSEGEQPTDDWRTHPEDFKLISLTYDDAPSFSDINGNSTVRIIDTINSYEGRGTLFVVGKTLAKNGNSLLRYAVEKGFELGNHTYSHRSVSTDDIGKLWTVAENLEDFRLCHDLVENQTNIKMKYLRPAGVHTNAALYQAASDLGLPCVSGNCKKAVSDYSSSVTSEMIVERVLENAFDGAIILLHGSNSRTADATERLCEILYNDGYRFCTVDELFRFKGYAHDDLPSGVMLYGVDPETGELIVNKEY